MQASELFSTPLWSFQHQGEDQLCEWSERILALERCDAGGLTLTNQGGWHSQTNLLADPGLTRLFLWIASCSQQAMDNFGWDMDKATPCFNNAWAMVNREGDSVRAHLHPNSLFSGVFYLTAPEGSGALAFLDPRAGAQVLLLAPATAEASPAARALAGGERRAAGAAADRGAGGSRRPARPAGERHRQGGQGDQRPRRPPRQPQLHRQGTAGSSAECKTNLAEAEAQTELARRQLADFD